MNKKIVLNGIELSLPEYNASGIFGGTFDPIHYGHLRPALELRDQLALSEVRFIPASVPPHREEPTASAQQRLAMLQLALQGCAGMSIDERELHLDGPSYMADTLRSLRSEVASGRWCCCWDSMPS